MYHSDKNTSQALAALKEVVKTDAGRHLVAFVEAESARGILKYGAHMRVFFSTGEPSGEYHAVELAHTMRRISPQLICEGIGSQRMREAGFRVRVDTRGWASLGSARSDRKNSAAAGDHAFDGSSSATQSAGSGRAG